MGLLPPYYDTRAGNASVVRESRCGFNGGYRFDDVPYGSYIVAFAPHVNTNVRLEHVDGWLVRSGILLVTTPGIHQIPISALVTIAHFALFG